MSLGRGVVWLGTGVAVPGSTGCTEPSEPSLPGESGPTLARMTLDREASVEADVPVSVTAGSVHTWRFRVTAGSDGLPAGSKLEGVLPPTFAPPKPRLPGRKDRCRGSIPLGNPWGSPSGWIPPRAT